MRARRPREWITRFVAALLWLPGAPGGTPLALAQRQPWSEALGTPREIAGVPCTRRASFAADGRLVTCTLSRDFTFANGVRLDAGSQVGLDAQMRPETVFLSRNTVIDGHHCIGDGSHDPMTKLHANGRLKFCNLVAPEAFQGVTCQKSTFWIWMTQGAAGVYFHDNGVLQQCLLAGDANVDGRRLPRKTHVQFDREGRLVPREGK